MRPPGADADRPDLGTEDRARLLDEARAALKEILVQHRDLTKAMQLFGDAFERDGFVRAFKRRREDPNEAARVNQVNWPLVTLINQMNTVLTSGAVLGGLRRLGQPDKAPEVYAALRGAAIIDRRRERDLTQLNRTRNALTHRYGLMAKADEVHAAAVLVLRVVKSFGDDFGDWLRSTGVLPKPPPG